uniref:Fatty acid binding protein 6 n=1 Tax=Varanus komodoensis TaxID=61221 RepID=A0A8D2IY53_VARKO
MSFSGKYEVESDENYDNFVKRIGLSPDLIEKGKNAKIITEVIHNGDEFTWSQIYPGGTTTTNKFVIGKESEMETMVGKKFKVNEWMNVSPALKNVVLRFKELTLIFKNRTVTDRAFWGAFIPRVLANI